MPYLIVIAVFVAGFGAFWWYRRRQRETAWRQCAFGNLDLYLALSNGRTYKRLEHLMQSADSFDTRYLYSVGLSRACPLATLQEWVDANPGSADALLCYGARLLQWSWDARGYGRGHEVSQQNWQRFFDRLDQTSQVLANCVDALPEDPTPWAYMTMVSTWRSDDLDDRWHYFGEALKRDPDNWAAHMHMVIALSAKWGGDNEDMISFARRVYEHAAEGSDLPVILLKAYIEQWKYFEIFQDRPLDAQRFLNSMDVRTRGIRAYEKSLGCAGHRDTETTVFARYNASAWFWMTRDADRLASELQALGSRIEDIHWRWTGMEGDLEEARCFAVNKDRNRSAE